MNIIDANDILNGKFLFFLLLLSVYGGCRIFTPRGARRNLRDHFYEFWSLRQVPRRAKLRQSGHFVVISCFVRRSESTTNKATLPCFSSAPRGAKIRHGRNQPSYQTDLIKFNDIHVISTREILIYKFKD
jgi:hypothetical protein